MMFFVTESGRVVDDIALVENEKYITSDNYPEIPNNQGKIGVITGIDVQNNKVIVSYVNAPVAPPEQIHLSDKEEAILETAVNVDYLVCLADLGL